MNKLTCQTDALAYLDYGIKEEERCRKPATHYSCQPYIKAPVCSDHKCRCKKYQDPIEIVDAREKAIKEPTPNHWMAL